MNGEVWAALYYYVVYDLWLQFLMLLIVCFIICNNIKLNNSRNAIKDIIVT